MEDERLRKYAISGGSATLRSPGSVVEIDTVKVGKKVHFSRFFCAFKGSIDGFREGCRPYISIDSTTLNGHMPAANAIDGHNWMFQ